MSGGTSLKRSQLPRLTLTGIASITCMLLASCAGSAPGAERKPLSIDESSLAQAQAPVSQRSGPEITRVPYPVAGNGDPSQNWGDLYLPAGVHKAGSVPLVVLIHGGAWHRSIGAGDFSYFAQDLVGRGVAVYNIEYRRVGSGGGWPTTFTDVASALGHVPDIVDQTPELSGKTEVVGHSAGAQLATWAGSQVAHPEHQLGKYASFKPDRIVALSGPLDMTNAANFSDLDMVNAVGGTPLTAASRYEDVDPIQNIAPGIPVVAVHGTADTTVSWQNSQRYIQALLQAGGNGRLDLLYGDTHGSLITSGTAHYQQVLETVADELLK